MTYTMYLLSILFVLGFVGFSSKPSPIYGGLGLIISGGVGCGIVLYFGGSFLGLMVFMIYLGGMLVVFRYTTTMSTKEYSETWSSNIVIWGVLLLGFLAEFLIIVFIVLYDGVDIVVELNNSENWMMFDGDELGLIREDSMEVQQCTVVEVDWWLWWVGRCSLVFLLLL